MRHKQEGEREVEVILTGGVILGVFDQIEDDISQKSVTLNRGDKIILYTDGVTEAINIQDEMYEDERLKSALKTKFNLDAEKFTLNILLSAG